MEGDVKVAESLSGGSSRGRDNGDGGASGQPGGLLFQGFIEDCGVWPRGTESQTARTMLSGPLWF
jgi:hypothetical protein